MAIYILNLLLKKALIDVTFHRRQLVRIVDENTDENGKWTVIHHRTNYGGRTDGRTDGLYYGNIGGMLIYRNRYCRIKLKLRIKRPHAETKVYSHFVIDMCKQGHSNVGQCLICTYSCRISVNQMPTAFTVIKQLTCIIACNVL